jgi:hypothetical protein
MVRSKIQKDLLKMFKNVKKMGVKSLKSTSTLYVVLALTLINLFVFINNQDNESLFLFLVISLLVYFKTTNMISVLLVPLILVNVLIYLRRLLMSGREGFAENAKMEEFIKFVVTIKDAPSEDDREGNKFYTDYVKPVISIKDNEIDSLENAKHILLLYKKLKKLTLIAKENDSDSESKYITKLVKRFNDHSNETVQTPKAKKIETYENYGKEGVSVMREPEEGRGGEESDDEEDDYEAEADDYESEEDDYEDE